ncbi:MAG: sugar phosphate isomerase/epimerase, partial [Sphingomonadaceae bacterium]|nr:sugar phosphate isomerase/epimerase [Sphingomonadaceae bacterium]
AGVTLYDAVGVALRADTDFANYEPLLDTAARLGAAGVMLTVWDEDMVRRAERYADFCERAARRGLDASVEFLPWSALRTIEAAAELVEAAGAANAGIMLDCLHLFRSGGSVEALRPHVGKIRYAQICDAPAVPPLPDDLMAEARQFRRNAGDGELPLGDIFALLPPDLPVSVEGPMQSPLSGLVRAETGLAAAKRVLG